MVLYKYSTIYSIVYIIIKKIQTVVQSKTAQIKQQATTTLEIYETLLLTKS